ncbi:MAG: SMC-Scp complex subunit ScpB [Candidatus Micrarchaeota archaeon]
MAQGQNTEITKKNTILAALFLANRPVSMDELGLTLKLKADDAEGFIAELADDLKAASSPFKVSVFEDPNKLAGSQVKLELEDHYLAAVSHLSKEIEFSKKAQKILALIAKKKELMQSELKYYFKGDIYEAVDELVKLKYLTMEKHKNTWKLKPTKLFFDRFKMVE